MEDEASSEEVTKPSETSLAACKMIYLLNVCGHYEGPWIKGIFESIELALANIKKWQSTR
jgi:hypothetical protein